MSLDKNLVTMKLEALRQEYGAQLARKIQLLEGLWARASEDRDDSAAFENFHRMAHSLAGSAGTFGYALVSELAQGIDAGCGEILDLGAAAAPEQTKKIGELLAQLKRSVAAAPAPKEGEARIGGVDSAPRRRDKLVALVDPDPEQAQALAVQIEASGYLARVFLDPGSVMDMLADDPPAAILMSLHFAEGRMHGIEAAREIREKSAARIPVIFLSTNDDFDTRLSAVRAGADGYLAKPPRLDALVELLDHRIFGRSARPIHVLVMTDHDATAAQVRSTLEADGMVVDLLDNAAQAIETLSRFKPDLVLAETTMPECTGLELAQVIRQDEACAAIPVIFLVSGMLASTRLLGLGLEDGDFLVKPFEPNALVELVADRVQRARVDRAAPAKDNLSEVLSQAPMVERFNQEARALRLTESSPAVPPVGPRPRPKILVVEDDPFMHEAIKIRLEGCGAEVLQAGDGEQAYEVAYWQNVDMIVTDYMMPKASGEYLLVRLKTNAETREIPVIVITQRKIAGRKDFALEREILGRLGAAAYLQKPLDLDALVDEVRRHVILTG